MPIIKYEFQPDIFKNPNTKKLGAIYRPYVLVKLGRDDKWSKNFIRALLDSGADNNVFPASFAREIGINYKDGQRSRIIGVGGQEVDSYMNFVKIKVNGKKELDTLIEFGDEIQTPLLGREGFFNYFDRITFNVKRRFIELKY